MDVTWERASPANSAARYLVPISEVADYPLQVKSSYKRVSDGAGGWVEIPVRYPVWIHPTADGKTPMCDALGKVKESARAVVDGTSARISANCSAPHRR